MSDELTADFHHEILDAIIGGGFEGGAVRGLMEYYSDSGSVNEKVRALNIDVDEIGGKLWCVTTMELTESLTPDELDAVKAYLVSLYSGNFGKNIEPLEIEIEQIGAIYISLGSSGSDFYILTEQEFIQRFEQEKLAYNSIPTTTEKLYSPLDFYIWNADATTTWREEVELEITLQYKSDIDVFMSENRLRYDTYDNYRGLMNYEGADSFAEKVHSVYPAVEEHSGRLWLAAEVRLTEPLTPQETADLKYWWVKEINDGWGGQVNQHEINTSLGEMVLDPQTEGTEFFIDTAQEFKRRLENETPAQAALWEPDASEDSETAMLRLQLIDRLDENLSEYFDSLRDLESREIADMSSEIGARMDAHYYLTGLHNFHASELNYLLQFQNPLEVVGDEFLTSDTENRSAIMWDVFHNQAALKGDYPLMPDNADEEPLKQKLFDRLDDNLLVYRENIMGSSKENIFNSAEDIAAHYAALDYLKTAYDYKTGEVEYLLQFQNPLSLASGTWLEATNNLITVGGMLDGVFADKSSHGHYALVTDASNPAAKESARGNSGIETQSVIERIRAAEKEPKIPHKDKSTKNKNEPER